MDIHTWIQSYKITSFDWFDGKTIYVNVEYYKPGQSINQPPVWDKSVFIIKNLAGQNVVHNFMDTLVNYIALLPTNKAILNFE